MGWAIRVARSRAVLFLRFERLSNEFAIGFLQQNLDAAFRFFELLLAFSRKLYALLE